MMTREQLITWPGVAATSQVSRGLAKCLGGSSGVSGGWPGVRGMCGGDSLGWCKKGRRLA